MVWAKIQRWLPLLAMCMATAALALSLILFDRAATQDRDISDSRERVTTVLCLAVNEERRALRVLIVRSPRVFEPLFRQFGGVSFGERVKQAKRDARTLPAVDCKKLLREVRSVEATSD